MEEEIDWNDVYDNLTYGEVLGIEDSDDIEE